MLTFFYTLFMITYWNSKPFIYDQGFSSRGYSLTAFSSKTGYHNNGFRPAHASQVEGMRLVHANLLFRHGTRSPGLKFQDTAKRYKAEFEKLGLNLTFQMESIIGKGDKQLLPAGFEELEYLGAGFAQRVPIKFRLVNNTRVLVTKKTRTLESARSFVSKFFVDASAVIYEEDAERLRFYDYCERYAKTIDKNKTLLGEYFTFMNGPEMQRVLEEVVADNNLESLGFTTGDIAQLHEMAGYEVAIRRPFSELPGWIKLFRPEHLFVVEYLKDLEKYYRLAAPFPTNYEQVCPLWGAIMKELRDSAMYDMLEDSEKATREAPKLGVYQFAHAETVLPLMTKLGLFNETVDGGDFIRATGFPERLRRLKLKPPVPNFYRSSHTIPFASNIAFMLFHCPRTGIKKSTFTDYCLEVLVNEQVVDIIPEVQERPLRLSTVLSYFWSCQLENYNKGLWCDLV